MPTCPPPNRKHSCFRAQRLAQGLQSIEGMKMPLLALISLAAGLLTLPSTSSAQLLDAVSSIDGAVFIDDAQTRYFNRRHCGLSGTGGTGGTGGQGGMGGQGGTAGIGGQGGTAGIGGQGGTAGGGGQGGAAGGGLSAAVLKSPEDTSFEIRLDQTGALDREVFLWVGTAGAQCEQLDQRDQTQGLCAEIPGNPGNPRPVSTDFLITNLTLQNLLDARAGGTEIVTCETSGLTGTEYKIFVFREAPANDVDPASYGVASVFVDIEAPAAPVVDTTPQRQASFQISWAEPDPPDLIQFWNFYSSSQNDASTATPLGITAALNERSATISASALGLADGETAYIFMNGFDQAFVSDASDANAGALSEGVPVTAVSVAGYCDVSGDCVGCEGCSAPRTSGRSGENATPWILGLLFGGILLWRRRR